MKLRQFSVATVNLYNLQLPGAAMNPNQRPWTTTEFDAKVTWLAARLTALDASGSRSCGTATPWPPCCGLRA